LLHELFQPGRGRRAFRTLNLGEQTEFHFVFPLEGARDG
jgi:hypothetical protein